ncbi:MAG: NAD(+) diphosphatase [Nocardioidaceae bacterium]
MEHYDLGGFPFSQPGHDRLAERRGDVEFLDSMWADPRTQVLVVHGVQLATNASGDRLDFVGTEEAPGGERMLLGRVGDAAYFVVLTDDTATDDTATDDTATDDAATDNTATDDTATDDTATGGPPSRAPGDRSEITAKLHADDGIHDLAFTGLRQLALRLDPVDQSLAVHAVALAGWHRRHPMCSVCGLPTLVVESGASRRCPNCSALHFPRTDPAVIMAVVDDDDRCLLGHNAAREPGWYSTLAGFVEPGEPPEQSVVREVAEECGVAVDSVAYAGSQPWPFPSQLMLGFFAHARTTEIDVDGSEITQARWFTRAELKSAVQDGEIFLPTPISISYALVAAWYRGELPPNRLPA